MSSTVRTLAEYRKLTSGTAEVQRYRDDLNNLKNVVGTELSNKQSPLSLELATMPEEQKSLLIAALVANDSAIFCDLLLPLLSPLNIDHLTNYLNQITKPNNSSDNDYWLNTTVRLIIDTMLQENVLDSHANTRNTRILQQAMQMIPESTIHIKAKVALCRELDYSAAQAISDYSYNESLMPLMTNRFSGNITVKEYKAALQSLQLDYSEYILLTLGLLQRSLSAEPVYLELNQIRQLYLNTDYETAIEKIKKMADKHQSVLGVHLYNLIGNKSGSLVEVDIHKNYPRRFFENRLAQLHSALELNLESINTIAQHILKKPVKNEEEAEYAILNISEDMSNALEIEIRVEDLKSQSTWYSMKDRFDKRGFSDKSMERVGEVHKEEVYSRNKGMLNSNAPNFYDELTEREIRNKVVDVASIYGEDVPGYSFSNPRGAFSASFSGHCFKIVATLEKYMQEHTKDKNLTTDINNFLKSVVTSYISRGYHGFYEMTDVLKEPHIQKVFQDCGIELDLKWMDNLVDKASKDSQEYTKALCLKKAVGASLGKSGFFSKVTVVETRVEPEKSNDEQIPDDTLYNP